MSEPTFLGLSKTEWDLINSFANWFSAAGSFAAAWVALHLANRIARPSADVSIGCKIIIGPGSSEPFPEYIVFRIVNSGDRLIRVTHIGWKYGTAGNMRYAMQIHDPSISSPMPIELSHGQEASWFVPMSIEPDPWPTRFAKEFLLNNRHGSFTRFRAFFARKTLRATFGISLGHTFSTRPERNLLEKLETACNAALAGQSAGATN